MRFFANVFKPISLSTHENVSLNKIEWNNMRGNDGGVELGGLSALPHRITAHTCRSMHLCLHTSLLRHSIGRVELQIVNRSIMWDCKTHGSAHPSQWGLSVETGGDSWGEKKKQKTPKLWLDKKLFASCSRPLEMKLTPISGSYNHSAIFKNSQII